MADQEKTLKLKNEAADKLIKIVGTENEIVQKEKIAGKILCIQFQFIVYWYEKTYNLIKTAAEEEKKVRLIEEDVIVKAKLCEADLRRAEPLLVAANEALNTLNKNNLTELKSFGTPPKAVINVCAAVLVLFSGKGKLPKDRNWRACKVCIIFEYLQIIVIIW